jgi:pyruvate dehydrogenase E1 component alpha subunit
MEPIRLLEPDGTLVGEPPIDVEETRRLYAAMLAARTYDHKASAMQLQGRLATYAPFEGQEAAQIGSVATLRSDDWLVATYRDAAAMWLQGYGWVNLLLGRIGDERGGSPPEGVRVLPPSITVGAHMLHAVGLAWGETMQGRDRIAMTMFGDGATSEGDFHEAMNFAAVYGVGTVFLCQNNQYAISMPRARQTMSATIAQKADGYGMPGVLVDGNDLLAVYRVAAEATERARSGGGPTLIEALTYRVGPHTTTDDPARYRPRAEPAEWTSRDPIDRLRHYLRAEGAWDSGWERAVVEEAGADVERAVAEAENHEVLEPDVVFDGMYATPTPELQRQQAELLRELGEG